MVADQFPMFKLGTLLARQASSPLAARIKGYAVSHPRFGAQVCSRVALLYHGCEWRARTLALRLGGVRVPRTAPPPLPPRVARDLGSDLLGEIIMFSLGALIVIFEVNRQANKQEVKELAKRSEWLAVSLSLQELQTEVTLQQLDLQRLRAALLALQDEPAPTPPGAAPHPENE